ncbi:MAG: carbon-nitrogen hydrolase [Kiritimatiellae bacterium]|nr:carbon-nitrogen hydrolase [Kiritimatiellia bacterium]MDW8458438.1 carbon-nitrogen hydrolase [Verrucomicrobiota bacterium]
MKRTIALVQMRCSTKPEENVRRAAEFVAEAGARGAHIVCLPELYRTPYFCQVEDASLFDLAEPVDGPSAAALGEVARKAGVTVIAPIFERRAPGLFHNSALVIRPDGGAPGLYRKMHIPDDPCFYEKYYFAPGDLGFLAHDTPAGRIGVLICWDQWYPEAARLTALSGAEILFYPTAIGWHPHEKEKYGAAQRDAWQTIQRAHAIANGVFVAAVNRIGHEKPNPQAAGLEFWGSSFVCDPFGVMLAEAPIDQEAVLLAEIDTARIEEVRRNWPFLRDRRIDAFGEILKRYRD